MENSLFNEIILGVLIFEFVLRIGVWYWVLRGLIGLIILVGNGVVIYVIVMCYRFYKVVNWFILLLLWVDLFVGFFLIFVFILCVFWMICNFLVLILGFDFLLVVFIVNMCVMIVDCYFFVVKLLIYF